MDKSELRRKRAELIGEARKLLDRAEAETRDLTADEEQRFKEIMGAVDWLAREIGGLSTSDRASFDEIEAELRQSQGTIVGPRAFEGSGSLYREARLGEVRALRPEERLASVVPSVTADGIRGEELSLGRMVRGIVTGDWRGAEAERRAMAEGVDTLGGFLVPDPLSARIIDMARARAVVMQAGALTVPMESHTLTLARVTGDPTAYWKAENASITPSDMSFGAITLTAKTLAALCRLSVELVEDAPNITQVVENAIAQALALELDRAALRGDGVSEPLGIRNTTDVQVIDLGANGAALTDYSRFSEAAQKIAEQNGPAQGLSAIYAPRTAGTIDRLTDSTGQPLKPPASFEGLRKLVSNQVPINLTKGTATNASEAYTGDFSQLLIGLRTQLTLEVSRQAGDSTGSAFRDLQVWIRAYLRADIALVRPSWFVVLDGIIP